MAIKVSALEVMPGFNTRSSFGRVVIEPPLKMPPLKLRETVPMYLCCGRAFLTESSYTKHREEVEVHGKPIDLSNMRTAKNDRSSLAFWRSRKPKAAMTHEEASIQRQPAEGDSSDDGEEEITTRKKNCSLSTRARIIQCKLCGLMIHGTNLKRHTRMCHNPASEFKCRHCNCQFSNTFGRMIHETKNHSYSTSKKLKTLKRQLTKPAATIPKPPRLTAALVSSSAVPTKSSKKKDECPGFKTLSKHAHMCLVCKKVIKGYQTVKDHMNIHKGLKPYACPVCGYKFTHKTNMNRHLAKGHTGGEFFCENGCGYSFSQPRLMTYHRRFCTVTRAQQSDSKHSTEVKLPTIAKSAPKLAKKQASAVDLDLGDAENAKNTIQQWQTNWTQFRSDGCLTCPVCHKNISGPTNFKDHLNMHAGIKPHSCTMCAITFTFKCNIRRHMTQCHVPNGSFVCKYGCGCRMATVTACQTHESRCTSKMKQEMTNSLTPNIKTPRPLVKVKQEPLRDLKFASSNGQSKPTYAKIQKPLKCGVPVASGMKGGTFTCKICGKWLISARNLRNHMMIHLNLKPHKCGLCGMAFRSFDQIKKHSKNNHVPTGAYRCSQCPCQFATEHGLSFHVTSRHTFRKRKTGLLLRKFKSVHVPPSTNGANSKVKMPKLIPMESQAIINKYKNDRTSAIKKEVGHKIDADNAENGAASSTRFPCNYCGKTFQSRLNLKYHIYSHTGEKPYKCKDCGYHFRRTGTLWDHQKHSHSGGEFQCTQCTCRFQSEIGLRRHNSIYHSETSRMTKSSTKIKLPTLNGNISSKSASNFKSIPSRANSTATSTNFTARKSVSRARNMPVDRSYSTTAYQFGSTTIAVSLPSDNNYFPPTSNPSIPSATKFSPVITERKSVQNGNSNKGISEKLDSSRSKFGCGHCGLNFGSILELSEHQTLHTKSDVDEIEIEIEDDTNTALEYNDQTEPNGPQTKDGTAKKASKSICPICGCAIHGGGHYKKHMNGCHNGGQYRCEKCPCQFHKLVTLRKHYTVQHKEKSAEKYIPKISLRRDEEAKVETEFDNMDTSNFFQNHFLLGDVTPDIYDEDPLQEPHPNEKLNHDSVSFDRVKKTPTATVTNNNVRRQPAQPADQERPFNCNVCDKNFKSNWLLKMHGVVHQTTYDHQCHICGQNFKTVAHVKMHMKKSHGNGKFKCSKCPSRFDSYRGLTTHNYCYHKGGREIKAQAFVNSLGRNRKCPPRINSNAAQTGSNVSSSIQSQPVAGMSKVTVDKIKLSVLTKESQKFSPKNRPIRCKVCGEICLGPGNLMTHMRSHSAGSQEPRQSNGTSGPEQSMKTLLEVVEDYTNSEIQGQDDQFDRTEAENVVEDEEDDVIMDYEDNSMNDVDASAGDVMASYNGDKESDGHLIRYELDGFNEDNTHSGNGDDNSDDFDVDSYDCEGCGLSFTSRVAFLRHIQSSGGGPFKCSYCCAVHATSSSLQGHLELYHDELLAAGH